MTGELSGERLYITLDGNQAGNFTTVDPNATLYYKDTVSVKHAQTAPGGTHSYATVIVYKYI